jgi:transposase
LHLPPYAPELNPVENVREYLRGNMLSALVWDSYEAIVTACENAWDFLVDDPGRIRSLSAKARGWASVNA